MPQHKYRIIRYIHVLIINNITGRNQNEEKEGIQ